MKQEQFERLQALHEKLVEVFLEEADPDGWPGHGVEPKAMDSKTRGDRYWCKKNAVATIALTQRIQSLVAVVRTSSADGDGTPADVVDEDEDLDRQTAAAEKEAKKLLADVQRKGAKAAFDKRVHGKA